MTDPKKALVLVILSIAWMVLPFVYPITLIWQVILFLCLVFLWMKMTGQTQ